MIDRKDTLIRPLPAEYRSAADKERQGKMVDVEYPVRNYINASRQFVTNQPIDSASAGRETVSGDPIMKSCRVYLPAAYCQGDPNARYDVLYLLHGVGGDVDEWLQGGGLQDERPVICNIIDRLVESGEIDPLIVVFPNGRSTHDWTDRSFTTAGTNILGFYYFDYELRYDLIPFIDAKFRTYPDRGHRAIAGLSMGGMQCLNLVLGGWRCDASVYTGRESRWDNGLDVTVRAPGMTDLFGAVGAFSNAPTSSSGDVLGQSVASGEPLRLLYMTCGDADGISVNCYADAISGLEERAGGSLRHYCQVLIRDGAHDFGVWHNGAYNFLRLLYGYRGAPDALSKQVVQAVLSHS